MYNPETHALVQSLDKRFAAVPRFCKVLEQNDAIEAWHSNIIGAIPLKTSVHYLYLKMSFRGSLELMSWASRNLLEMFVWSTYVAKSKENARRFLEDQVVDGRGLLDSIQALVKSHNVEKDKHLAQIEKDRAVLKTKFAETALKGDEGFLSVGREASKLDLAGTFYGLNGFYSKLAHPTAFSIMFAPDAEQDEQMRTFMVSMALLTAKDALDIMAELYRSLGTDTSLIEDPSYSDPGTLRPKTV